MTMMGTYDKIAGLTGTQPIGVVLRVGGSSKNAFGRGRGADREEKNAFQLVDFKAGGDGSRGQHPLFTRFNSASTKARQSIQVVLVHAEIDAAYRAHLQIYRGPPGTDAPPYGTPFCTGDGERATRWRDGELVEIECPHRACKFQRPARKSQGGRCKPAVTLLCQPVWPSTVVVSGVEQPHPWQGLTTPLMLFESGSWKVARAFLGLFDSLREQFAMLGAAPVVYGLRLLLRVQQETSGTGGDTKKHPVVRPSLLTPDLQLHIANMASRSREIAAHHDALATALTTGATVPAIDVAHTPAAIDTRARELGPTRADVTPPRSRPAIIDDVEYADPDDQNDPRPRRPL